MGGFAQIYKDKTAPVEDRTNDLLHRMTLEEKLDYIGGYKGFYIRGIERLGVPEIKLTDGPVGTHKDGKSTAYPAGVLTASTWNRELVYELGKQFQSTWCTYIIGTGREYRAFSFVRKKF